MNKWLLFFRRINTSQSDSTLFSVIMHNFNGISIQHTNNQTINVCLDTKGDNNKYKKKLKCDYL